MPHSSSPRGATDLLSVRFDAKRSYLRNRGEALSKHVSLKRRPIVRQVRRYLADFSRFRGRSRGGVRGKRGIVGRFRV